MTKKNYNFWNEVPNNIVMNIVDIFSILPLCVLFIVTFSLMGTTILQVSWFVLTLVTFLIQIISLILIIRWKNLEYKNQSKDNSNL